MAGCHSAATCPAGNLSPSPSGPCSNGTSAVVLALVLVVLLVLVGPAAITRANGYQAGSPLVKGSNHATDKLVNLCVRMRLTSFLLLGSLNLSYTVETNSEGHKKTRVET